MRYRDLIPGRLGGHLIASHIHIPDGGPVGDDVHFHEIRFQLIYCVSGWVRLVYEDQGPPFVLAAGDAVLQPPRIRHRVLECSDELEVVELACPAEHDTWLDHELELPTPELRPDRDFEGQRFVRHVAERAEWEADASDRRRRSLGLGPATGGRVEAHAVELSEGAQLVAPPETMLFAFVLDGTLAWTPTSLGARDSVLLPPNCEQALTAAGGGARVLAVHVPHTPWAR